MKWYVGVTLILVAALLLDSGLLAYAMYVLLGVLVVSRLLARSWVGRLTATRSCDVASAEVGDAVPVTVTVRNHGKLPVPWVILEDLLPPEALQQRPPRLRVKGKRLMITMIGAGKEVRLRYTVQCEQRGYYPIGPLVLESGDVFGLHRRFRVETEPHFLLVYPRVVALEGYELASRRPIGDVVLTHRLYEDPTRIAGVRPYEAGDPLNRVHWRATARTGQLHSKVYEPTTLAGATLLLDFHRAGYHRRGEPHRSELAVSAAVSLANAVYEMGQQVGLVTNARDAADRIRRCRTELIPFYGTRRAARRTGAMQEKSERLEPLVVETRRGAEQLQRIREALGRVELTDGTTFAGLVLETAGRLPRDATVVALLPEVPVESAVALGSLRRQGFAVTAVLVALDAGALEKGHGRLLAEGVRDVRHLARPEGLPTLCRQQVLGRGQFTATTAEEVAAEAAEGRPEWMEQRGYEMDSPEG
jgi:uncharacterized repeat protein (TIGR01451 family)